MKRPKQQRVLHREEISNRRQRLQLDCGHTIIKAIRYGKGGVASIPKRAVCDYCDD